MLLASGTRAPRGKGVGQEGARDREKAGRGGTSTLVAQCCATLWGPRTRLDPRLLQRSSCSRLNAAEFVPSVRSSTSWTMVCASSVQEKASRSRCARPLWLPPWGGAATGPVARQTERKEEEGKAKAWACLLKVEEAKEGPRQPLQLTHGVGMPKPEHGAKALARMQEDLPECGPSRRRPKALGTPAAPGAAVGPEGRPRRPRERWQGRREGGEGRPRRYLGCAPGLLPGGSHGAGRQPGSD